jgi:hypothetical protein
MTLKEFLKENGFKVEEHDKAQSHQIPCQHKEGLPRGNHICQLKPSYSPSDSTNTILVDNESVSSYTCSTPYFHRSWRLNTRIPYNSPEELKTTLEAILKPAKGCWS